MLNVLEDVFIASLTNSERAINYINFTHEKQNKISSEIIFAVNPTNSQHRISGIKANPSI